MAIWRGSRWKPASTSAWRCFDHRSIKPGSPLNGSVPLQSVAPPPSHRQEPCRWIKVARNAYEPWKNPAQNRSMQRSSLFQRVSSRMIQPIWCRLLSNTPTERSAPFEEISDAVVVIQGSKIAAVGTRGKSTILPRSAREIDRGRRESLRRALSMSTFMARGDTTSRKAPASRCQKSLQRLLRPTALLPWWQRR